MSTRQEQTKLMWSVQSKIYGFASTNRVHVENFEEEKENEAKKSAEEAARKAISIFQNS